MIAPLWLAMGLAAVSVLALPPGRRRVVDARLTATLGRGWPSQEGARAARRVATHAPRLPRHRIRQLSAGLAGLGFGLLVGGAAAPVLGLIVGVLLDRVLARLEAAAATRHSQVAADDIPAAVDLLAACLLAGAALPHAASTVGDALGGPVGHALHGVASAIRLGADPVAAWLSLADEPAIAPLARVVSRAVASGAPLAETMTRFADDQRARRRHATTVAAQKAGIRAVAPLGLCFLPAFVLLSIVPFVASVAGDVLGGLS